MTRSRFTFCAVASALAVLGCTTPPQQGAGVFVKPQQTIRHGAGPDANYAIGRYFQGQQRYDDAINAYRQALVGQPAHVGALNALGVIYSLQKQPELAEQYFNAALAVQPADAQVLNNLGYHFMTNGHVPEAVQVFERARAADPGNTTVVANLAAAQAQLPAATAVTEAAEPAQAPAPSAPVPAPAAPAAQVAAPAAVAVAPQPAPASQAAPAPQAAPEIAPVTPLRFAGRIEISNGNGTAGLARSVSQLLAGHGPVSARLTNHKPYGVVRSNIQYVAGAEQEARQINEALPVPLPLAQVGGLERKAPVRVLLGKDFPSATVITQLSTRRAS